MTKSEVTSLMQFLRQIYSVVRLVDLTRSLQTTAENGELVQSAVPCFKLWNKQGRCENCVSLKALQCHGQVAKFEFSNEELFFVNAVYVEVDGVPCALELVSVVNDSMLFGAYGRDHLIESLAGYDKKIYMDSLTEARNRRYYDEQLQFFAGEVGLAIMDVDCFKEVNDTYGHQIGDKALQEIVRTTRRCVRQSDTIVRYGGDEFLIVFQGIRGEVLPTRLEHIRQKISEIRLEECPEVRLTVSIGALFCDGEAAQALKLADDLLYQAKKERNTVQVLPFTPR